MSTDERGVGFRTWCVERPEIKDSIIRSAVEHHSGTYEISWSGSETDLSRVRAEAARRSVTLVVREARYTKPQLRAAVQAIIDEETRLAAIGFELHGIIAAPDPDGLIITGQDSRRPDNEDDDPLEPRLRTAVIDHLLALEPIRNVFRTQDVRIEPGRVYPL